MMTGVEFHSVGGKILQIIQGREVAIAPQFLLKIESIMNKYGQIISSPTF